MSLTAGVDFSSRARLDLHCELDCAATFQLACPHAHSPSLLCPVPRGADPSDCTPRHPWAPAPDWPMEAPTKEQGEKKTDCLLSALFLPRAAALGLQGSSSQRAELSRGPRSGRAPTPPYLSWPFVHAGSNCTPAPC